MSGVREAALMPASVPVVLLDIDGVISMGKPHGCFAAAAAVKDRHAFGHDVYRQLFLSSAVRALNQVHDEMDAKLRYVFSSTWRESLSRAQLGVVFRRVELGFVADRLHVGEKWRTPPKFGCSRRIDEIAQWLDRHHKGEPFAILDDTHSGASLAPALGVVGLSAPRASSNVPALGPSGAEPPHPFAGRVVLCQENVGLTFEHIPFIVAALRRAVPQPGRSQ